MKNLLQQAMQRNMLRPIDVHFAQYLLKTNSSNETNELAFLITAALCSFSVGNGHVCLDLTQHAIKPWCDPETKEIIWIFPDLKTWRYILLNQSNVSHAKDEIIHPLVLDDKHNLYLGRYWQFEKKIIQNLMIRSQYNKKIDLTQLKKILDDLFPNSPENLAINWQKVAAAVSSLQNFSIISGGPGTGKTYTVTRILALLIALFPDKNLNIALTAPTGKAATRLSESIQQLKNSQTLGLNNEIMQKIPDKARTIHRLLGVKKGRVDFHFHQKNPLPYDVIVIDEASMIDIALMSRIIQSLQKHTRLILLGDKNQLSSVEAGSIFSDLCYHDTVSYSAEFSQKLTQILNYDFAEFMPKKTNPLQNNLIYLQHSYRFNQNSGIGQLANCINQQNTALINPQFFKQFSDVQFNFDLLTQPESLLTTYISHAAIQNYQSYLQQENVIKALQIFNQFQILCAVRKGITGVEQINLTIQNALKKQGLIQSGKSFYHGRPIMITENNYHHNLFNGDIGLLWKDKETNNILAHFIQADGNVKTLSPNRLPHHETVYAMTIHKSQGSEFDHIFMVLPKKMNPILNQQLIYTGITRAKKKIDLIATKEILDQSINTTTLRHSGLIEAIFQ